MLSSFPENLRRLDYRAIAACATEPRTELDRYLAVRSRIILGDYDGAEARLGGLPSGFSRRFLECQLGIFRRQDLPTRSRELLGLTGGVPDDPYWLAEYHLIAGYLCQLLDEFTQASRHQAAAAEHYRAADLAVCEAIALFNLCVCHDHLNQRDEMRSAFRQLEAVADANRVPAVELFRRRMRGNLSIDREDYSAARDDLRFAWELCRETGRWRDAGSIRCVLDYLALKLGEEPTADVSDPYLPEHRRVLNELAALGKRALLPAADAQRLLARWRKHSLDSVFLFLLVDALLERALRAQEYEWVLRAARQAGQASLRRQQALTLVDFRHYEVACLLKLGRTARAATVWQTYARDAAESGSVERQRKARALQPGLHDAVPPDCEGDSELLLDTGLHEARWHGRRLDLTRTPLIEKLLVILMRGSAVPLPAVYTQLYGGEYHFLLHGRRLHSLIDRTRRLFRDRGLIVRREGMLALSARCRPRVMVTRPTAPSGAARRERLRELIARSPGSVSLSDLEGRFDWSRRTLQMDLRALIASGALRAVGRTRKRRYYLETA